MIESFQSLIFLVGKRSLDRSLRTHPPGSKTAGMLAAALNAARRRKFSDTETSWITRIEELRERLAASSDQVSFQDFGAGASGATRDASSDRTVGEICRSSSITRSWGILLFQIVRHTRPSVCLELGTSLGISASYLGAACILNGRGTVITLEGASSVASLAQKNLVSLGLTTATVIPGRFQDTLESTLTRHRPIDFAFIDGHHDRDATLRYFNQIKPHLSDQAMVVFDDILWSGGMRQAWREIRRNAGSSVKVNLVRMGILCYDKTE
ncbi:MAG: class I SAM-dependent methyltransferase [Bacteroidota bacterium]